MNLEGIEEIYETENYHDVNNHLSIQDKNWKIIELYSGEKTAKVEISKPVGTSSERVCGFGNVPYTKYILGRFKD